MQNNFANCPKCGERLAFYPDENDILGICVNEHCTKYSLSEICRLFDKVNNSPNLGTVEITQYINQSIPNVKILDKHKDQ